jgi:hypothetical protein
VAGDSAVKLLTKDEARGIAANIAKLPVDEKGVCEINCLLGSLGGGDDAIRPKH